MLCDNHTLLHGEKSTLEFSDSAKHVQLCPIKKNNEQTNSKTKRNERK